MSMSRSGYSQKDREQIITNSLQEYRNVIYGYGCSDINLCRLKHLSNLLGNTWTMCSKWNTKGLIELREAIEDTERRIKQALIEEKSP